MIERMITVTQILTGISGILTTAVYVVAWVFADVSMLGTTAVMLTILTATLQVRTWLARSMRLTRLALDRTGPATESHGPTRLH